MTNNEASTHRPPPAGEPPLEAPEVVARHDNDALVAIEYPIAEFSFRNGLEVVFSYDEASGDLGLLQQGRLGATTPIARGEIGSLLEVYLDLAPDGLAIPEELLSEASRLKHLAERIKHRGVAAGCVSAAGLELPVAAPVQPREGQSCSSTYYSWWDWHDAAAPGLAPKCYYASEFGGKRRYSESYVFNCVPEGSPGWLWARHRIYYKNAFGNYVNQFEGKVPPGHWQAKTKGSVKRWRRVCYDEGWDSLPTNSSLKYTREGRFTN